MSTEADRRKKAKELGAPEAEAMIAAVPHLARLLTKSQVVQIQNVLDAAVLNPLYEDAFRKAMKDSVIARSGNLVLRDSAKERKAHRILDKRIAVAKSDGFIRIDHNKMLTADALVPRTNNPDEADYLMKVRQTLNSKGVWLRLGQPWSAQGPDPTVWEFWFSLGPDGDTIKTDDAIIDRDELLGTMMLGAGYYRAVLTGHVQTKIKRAFESFDSARDDGWSFHMSLMKDRHSAAIGVVKVADFLGGASFPSFSIWDRPNTLRMKAWDANVGGDVVAAQVYLLVAAHALEYNAELLADYVRKTIGGAETAVTILEVAKTAGQVAEVALVVVGVGAGVKALRVAGGKAITQDARHEAAEQFVRRYAEREGISQAELKMVRYVPQPKGTVLGNIKGGHSAGYGTGPHKWP